MIRSGAAVEPAAGADCKAWARLLLVRRIRISNVSLRADGMAGYLISWRQEKAGRTLAGIISVRRKM
jgi:hypothetical protein